MTALPRCLLPALIALLPLGATADPLFESHDLLAIAIDAPLGDVSKQRDSDEYHEGRLVYTEADGQRRELDVKLRARGRYRRRDSTCTFPPIRLNFRKQQVDDTLFDGQDKLKLVTHCQTSNSRYEQFLLKEYLAYRMLQVLTDTSFRVRLLRIRWADTNDDDEPFERYGFLIEDEDRLGKRIGHKPSRIGFTKPGELVPEQSALVGVHQYLIANTDFSMLLGPADSDCCHNIVLFGKEMPYIPIPYDFDFSGLVGAPYAEPNPELSIRSVRTRLYRGRCEHNPQLAVAIELVRARRADIFALIDDQEGLDDRNRSRARKFIEDFYRIVDDPKRVRSRLVRRCV